MQHNSSSPLPWGMSQYLKEWGYRYGWWSHGWRGDKILKGRISRSRWSWNIGMSLHEGKLWEASQSFSFFLENLSTTPLNKQTGGAKGVPLLAVRAWVVAPLFSHVSRVVMNWVTLFSNGRGALLAQNMEKLQGVNFFLHFSRKKF